MNSKIKEILSNYSSENPGTKANLYRILMQGRLKNTGKMIILPVDQGFEHGPARSFAINPEAYDPEYHAKLALAADINAYAAPLGFIEHISDNYAGQLPLILKLNSSNSLTPKSLAPSQAMTGSVFDAVRLGCVAVGLTIYPGSANMNNMLEQAREIIKEAKSLGLLVVVWSYPRGADLSKPGETAIDVTAYAAHIAALIGAHIIKVKLPSNHIENAEAKAVYQSQGIEISKLEDRVNHVMQSCFNGKRLVVFSGGTCKDKADIIAETKAINAAGGSGSIIGRNSFQRPFDDALKLLSDMCDVYLNN